MTAPSEIPTSTRERLAALVAKAPFGLSALVLGLAVLGLGAIFPHSELLQRLIWPCPLKASLGVPCPTCGATRVAVLLARGHLLDAIALAPIPALTLLGALLFGGAATLAAVGRTRAPPTPTSAAPRRALPRWSWPLAAAVLALLYGFTLWRHAHTGMP